jgi:hypothetical protein
MRKLMTAGLALSAVVAVSGKANAYVNYPWCIIGETRGIDCVFETKEQCTQDGRNRGFGGQCTKNPFYNPALPSVVTQGSPLNSLGGPIKKVSPVAEGEGPTPSRRKHRRH